jgi:hypothetical protein
MHSFLTFYYIPFGILQGSHSDSCFPQGYVASIAGRAVANTNKHPTANKFRQFSSPKVFDVIRKGKQNEVLIQHLFQRLVFGGSGGRLSMSSSAMRSTDTFVTDFLPSMRRIVPNGTYIYRLVCLLCCHDYHFLISLFSFLRLQKSIHPWISSTPPSSQGGTTAGNLTHWMHASKRNNGGFRINKKFYEWTIS